MKKKRILWILILCFCVVMSGHFALTKMRSSRTITYHYGTEELQDYDYTDTDVSVLNRANAEYAREKYTHTKGKGKDTVTVMFYMIGSDEENISSTVISTLNSILYAGDSEKTNVIIETGGSSSWNSSILEDGKIQRWLSEDDTLKCLDEDVQASSMCDPDTLYDFLSFTQQEYPADRYFLFLSGSGNTDVFGYDPDGIHTDLSWQSVAAVFSRLDYRFDLIGLDVPYASTYENAVLFEPYADYMIAPETDLSSSGFLYGSFLSKLADNTSVSSLSLGKLLIDSYALNLSQKKDTYPYVISLTDLSEIRYINDVLFNDFGSSLQALIENGTYQTVSDILYSVGMRDVRSESVRMDPAYFARRVSVDEAKALSEALIEAIKYRRTSSIANAYGLTMPSPLDLNASSRYYPKGYTDFLNSCRLYTALGQSLSSLLYPSFSQQLSHTAFEMMDDISAETLMDTEVFRKLITDTSVYTEEQMENACTYVLSHHTDLPLTRITKKNDRYITALDETSLTLLQDISMHVLLRKNETWMNLGTASSFTYNSSTQPVFPSSLLLYTYEGIPVPFVSFTKDVYSGEVGLVRALLNGRECMLSVSYDRYGYRLMFDGAYLLYPDSTAVPKGKTGIREGDTITFLYDTYASDGTPVGTLTQYEPITVTDSLYLSETNTEEHASLSMVMRDFYGNSVHSEFLIFPYNDSQ